MGKTEKRKPDPNDPLASRLKPGPSQADRDEVARGLRLAAEYAAMSDEERIQKFIALDRLARNLTMGMKQQREQYEERLIRQSRGRATDMVTSITMDSLRRDHAEAQTRAERIAQIAREELGDKVPPRLLAELERAPSRRAPTPGKKLLAWKRRPTKVEAADLILQVERAYKAPCPERSVLLAYFEHALDPEIAKAWAADAATPEPTPATDPEGVTP